MIVSCKFNEPPALPEKHTDRWCGKDMGLIAAWVRGMVGFRKFVISAPLVNEIGADDEIVTLLSKITFQDQDGFEGRWSLYCD